MNNTNVRRYGCMPRRYPSPYVTPPAATCAPAVPPCEGQVVAMAYVPWQTLETVYEAEDGYVRGTVFPELDKPLMVGGVCCG